MQLASEDFIVVFVIAGAVVFVTAFVPVADIFVEFVTAAAVEFKAYVFAAKISRAMAKRIERIKL